jgi:hypothetical protein
VERRRWWSGRHADRETHGRGDAPDVTYVSDELLATTVALIAHDLAVTMGWSLERAGALAQVEAQSEARIDRWDDDVEFAFPLAVAEDAQQYLHDTFEDTGWPACPTHARHPLWLSEEEGQLPTWRCPADGDGYGRLGALRAGHPS